MIELKQVDLAYAAGIIDGEGCIKIFRVPAAQLKRNFDRYSLQVQVDMVNPAAIQWLQDKFGGKVYDHIRDHIKHPTWNNSKGWYIYSQQAGVFLNKILPYLLVRVEQAKIALDFLKLPPKSELKQVAWENNRKLNKRGL